MNNKKNKNICIFTWYDSINYGTCLQAYSLVRFLKNNEYNAYLVDDLKKYYYGIHNPFQSIYALLRKYIKKMFSKVDSEHFFTTLNNDIQKKYKDRKLKNTKIFYSNDFLYSVSSKSDYRALLENTSVFISGSDQIWNPNFVSPINLLAFADNKKHRKIAYASSMGVDKIPFSKKNFYKKYLSHFYKIGVREKTAQAELSKLLNREVTTVLDPTFLLETNEWEKIINDNFEALPKKKYIFCYFIGQNREWENVVKEYANNNGYEVYCALSESYIIPNVGISKPELGVEEFLNYLINADMVATDSFHAVALSINFNKKFAVFKRFKDNDKKSQNSRIVDVLSTFKLVNQLVDDQNFLENVFSNEIDYNETNKILKNLREFSTNFLLNAIEEEL